MALVDLLAGLEAEAAAETASLEAETREEADRIVEAARAEARALREQAARAGEGELQREAEQRRALARLAAAAVVREAREEAFPRVSRSRCARDSTLSAERAGYPPRLRALIRESMDCAPRPRRHCASTRATSGSPRTCSASSALELDVVAAVLETAGGVELDERRRPHSTQHGRGAARERRARAQALFGEHSLALRAERGGEHVVSILRRRPISSTATPGCGRARASCSAPSEYEALIGRDLDGIFEALAGTAYRPEIEAVLAVSVSDRRALHEALRRHLARALGELRAFYDGRARELVDLLLSRFDLHNLLALLRGQRARAAAEEMLAERVPAGRARRRRGAGDRTSTRARPGG